MAELLQGLRDGMWTRSPDGQVWNYNNGKWKKGKHAQYPDAYVPYTNLSDNQKLEGGLPIIEVDNSNKNNILKTDEDDIVIGIGPLKGSSPTKDNKTARYPSDSRIDSTTDYVFFQFGKYQPPFGKLPRKGYKDEQNADWNSKNSQENYNISTDLRQKDIATPDGGSVAGIVLPMPQDLGNDLQQTWNGKQFSALGRAAIAGAAGGNFAMIGNRLKDMKGNLTSTVASLQTTLLNKIPGVGGNLDLNDITGSTKGIVLNPNAEVLYDTAELREIGMTFKMIPRSAIEAKIIKNIVYMFRYASVPAWGGGDDFGDGFGDDIKDFKTKDNASGTKETIKSFGQDNFVRVPYLCKFTFMTGGKENKNVQQFKPCAIRKVAVNYTSDGTYATYRGGEPVATELTLNFLESKILFKSDIAQGF